MSKFKKHIFVCENERTADYPRGCCSAKDSKALRKKLKELIIEAGLTKDIRANTAGCLDHCEQGACMVVYPENVWSGPITEADINLIFEQHLCQNKPVTQLQINRG